MSHLRFIACGWDRDLDYMEKFIGTFRYRMEVEEKGVKKQIIAPLYLRPFRMYDLIYPREAQDTLLNTLKPQSKVGLFDGKQTLAFGTQINLLRKAMKLKKIPKPDMKKGYFDHPSDLFNNIRIIGLGIKEDIDFTNDAGVTQEGL